MTSRGHPEDVGSSGRLPSYEQLDSDSASWLGMSMAYLVGSAYLEWLTDRSGPESLRKLWARATSRSGRSFDEAFEGVYGDSPRTLYQRFCAELTAKAMAVENASGEPRNGALWQDLSWTTESPDVSKDGKSLVTVRRWRDRPSSLQILSTTRDEKAEKEHAETIARLLARDPEDVAPVETKPLPRKPEHELRSKQGEAPFSPRFIDSTDDVLFVRFEPDRDGFLHPDLFVWTPPSENVRRLTNEADLRDADPSPDGSFAVAIRNRYGQSELVRVELATGAVATLAGPSLDILYADPRVSPDGKRAVYVRKHQRDWDLVIRDLGSSSETAYRVDGIVAQPAWEQDGTARRRRRATASSRSGVSTSRQT